MLSALLFCLYLQVFAQQNKANETVFYQGMYSIPVLNPPKKAMSIEDAIAYKDSVISLEISFQSPKLTSIPKEIELFPNLKWLDVSYNRVSIIPREILNCKNLVCLDLTGNQYLQTLPDFLNELPNLKVIKLKDISSMSSTKRVALQKKFPKIYLDFK